MNDARRQTHIDELVSLGENRQQLEAMTAEQMAQWAAQALLANAAKVAELLRDARTTEFPDGVPVELVDHLLTSAAQTVNDQDVRHPGEPT